MDRPDDVLTQRGVPAKSWWRLSHCSKTTPVSTNERDPRNENCHRSATMVAQSHVIQADDALVAVSNGSHYAKAWCYCGSSTHPTSIQRGTLEERRAANVEPARKKSTQVICSRRYGNDTCHTGRKQIMDMSVWNSVKDPKAPACCALAAPECNVTSERCVSTLTDCTEYRNRTQKMKRAPSMP